MSKEEKRAHASSHRSRLCSPLVQLFVKQQATSSRSRHGNTSVGHSDGKDGWSLNAVAQGVSNVCFTGTATIHQL